MHLRWSLAVFLRSLLIRGVSRFANLHEEIGTPITAEPPQGFRTGRDRLSWSDIGWLRQRWQGRLVLNGVLHPSDAQRAAALGVDGIIVFSHVGRQLDGAIAPLHALPEVVRAVPVGFPVFMDGAGRRGSDVLKAMALGAKLVFIGRPTLYRLATAGQSGVSAVLQILQQEIDPNLALLGSITPDSLTPDLLRPHPRGYMPPQT